MSSNIYISGQWDYLVIGRGKSGDFQEARLVNASSATEAVEFYINQHSQATPTESAVVVQVPDIINVVQGGWRVA